jgi:aryl-alcohol dehydrogenase-like predicted oxidoreductase
MSNETYEQALYFNKGFESGAKWQAERMYSEEDLREAFSQGEDNMDYSDTYGWTSKRTVQQWFEQFKKKKLCE